MNDSSFLALMEALLAIAQDSTRGRDVYVCLRFTAAKPNRCLVTLIPGNNRNDRRDFVVTLDDLITVERRLEMGT